jgi:hypothetical protein
MRGTDGSNPAPCAGESVLTSAQPRNWLRIPRLGGVCAWAGERGAGYEATRRRAQELEEQRKPQPAQIIYAIGSMEWLAEQNKSK